MELTLEEEYQILKQNYNLLKGENSNLREENLKLINYLNRVKCCDNCSFFDPFKSSMQCRKCFNLSNWLPK